MPSTSKSQQRLFGMVHAYQKGKLKHAPAKIRSIAGHISEDDAKHFAKTRHDGLPERRGKERGEEKAAAWRAGFLWKCAEYGVDVSDLLKKAQAYEPPWTIDRIREEYGDEVADRLAEDPVHKWRSDTGIELVHREPDEAELRRVIANWKLMTVLKKRLSNKKSRELFGKTNLAHAKELLKEYGS